MFIMTDIIRNRGPICFSQIFRTKLPGIIVPYYNFPDLILFVQYVSLRIPENVIFIRP